MYFYNGAQLSQVDWFFKPDAAATSESIATTNVSAPVTVAVTETASTPNTTTTVTAVETAQPSTPAAPAPAAPAVTSADAIVVPSNSMMVYAMFGLLGLIALVLLLR